MVAHSRDNNRHTQRHATLPMGHRSQSQLPFRCNRLQELQKAFLIAAVHAQGHGQSETLQKNVTKTQN